MDHAENNDSFYNECKDMKFMLETILHSRSYTQVPLNPKIELLKEKMEKAGYKLFMAQFKAIEKGNPDAASFLRAHKRYYKRINMLMNFALKIDAELHQADLN